MKLTRYFHLVLLAWLWCWSILRWPEVSAGATGDAAAGPGATGDGMSLPAWLLLPSIAALDAVISWLVSRYAVRNPRRINLPSKERILALPPEAQTRVLGRVREALGIVGLSTAFILLMAQRLMYRVALGQDATGALVAVLLAAVLAGPVILVALVVTTQRALEQEGA